VPFNPVKPKRPVGICLIKANLVVLHNQGRLPEWVVELYIGPLSLCVLDNVIQLPAIR
jgi:hypothetical protein